MFKVEANPSLSSIKVAPLLLFVSNGAYLQAHPQDSDLCVQREVL